MLTLVFSQVTIWIFARSLLNAAILGDFYGIAGALAYSAKLLVITLFILAAGLFSFTLGLRAQPEVHMGLPDRE